MTTEPRERATAGGVQPARVEVLLKFGAADHMVALCESGRLYLNTIDYFKALEADSHRGDANEGLERYWRTAHATFASGPDAPDYMASSLVVHNARLHLEAANQLHLFSAYGIDGIGIHAIDRRCREFGDCCILIQNPSKFMQRLRLALEKLGLRSTAAFVKYVSRDVHDGPMGPFRKFSEYAWQREFRVLIYPEVAGPLILELGSLEDISSLYASAGLEEVEVVGTQDVP